MSSSFFSSFTSSSSTEEPAQNATPSDPDDGAASSEGSDDELDVEDYLYAAQMELIAHHHPQAIVKLQQAVALSSSAACATLGNLLSRGLRGEHLSQGAVPEVSPPIPTTSSDSKRPTILRTHTTPLTHAASDEDSLTAAKLFVKGLEIELKKPLEPVEAAPKHDMYESDAEEGTEGRFFSLERALDLVVGLTDSYRFGVLHPPSDDLPSEKDETWNRGASIAHEILAHSSISMPPPLQSTASLPPLASSSRPHSAARSVSRSYAHPSMTLPPPAAHPHPHAHLSPSTKLRITVTVHALYLLALQVWPTDKGAAEGYWKDIISVGGTGVGTKEGEEVVERARRRVEGIHHKEGPGEAWHLAKQKGRGRKAKRGVTTGTVGMDALEGEARDALCEIWQEKREKEELWQAQAHASVSPPAVKVDRKGKGRARSSEEEQPPTSGSFAASSAITIRANGEHDHSRGPCSLSTSTISNSRTPRPSKFHFAQDPPDSYPSPPDTPGHSPPPEVPHEGHGIVASSSSFTNTIATEEPESYFPIQPSTSPETSISTSRSLGSQAQLASTPLAPPRRIASRASIASAHPLSPSSRLLSRVRSSASVSTLPPDFGSTRPAWSRQSSKAVGGVSLASSGGERVGRARSSTTAEETPLLPAAESSSGWRSGWKSRLSSLKESSSRILEGLKSSSSDGGPLSAAEVLRRMLEKDDESAGPGMEWAVLEEEGLETEAEGEHPEELDEAESDQYRPDQQQFSDADLLAPPQPPFASDSNSGSRSPSSSGQHTPTLHLSPKSSKPRLQRLKSSISTRSFIDVTSAEPRYFSALTNPPTPERGSRSSSLVAAHQRRSFSSPDLPGAPRDMDPLLVELERKSRVGVKTVCATCGKKGLNYPKARGGQTYCSRDCRVKGLKVQETMEGRERDAMAAAARVSVAAQV